MNNKKRLCIGKIVPGFLTGKVAKFATRQVTLACGRQLPVYHLARKAVR